MKYISTRDTAAEVSASQAILRGISPEGGLYVPAALPQVDAAFLAGLQEMDYPARARAVMELFLDDFAPEDLEHCVQEAYVGTFEEDRPAPVTEVEEGLHLLELWHGPTCAFKDIALQMLPQLLRVARKNTGDDRTAVILVATSGDTGKAALEGFADVEGTRIVVFYPEDGVSAMQQLQMATQRGANVAVQAVQGNFDDCQSGVKALFADARLANILARERFYLTSANSINWGRLLPQIVYYFSAYADLVKMGRLQQGELLDVTVPTGNFGNILACYYAKRMGLPIGRMICASNRNDVLTEFIRTGTYDRRRELYLTNSPSMDILVSSNLERLLFELFDRDERAVGYCMYRLNEGGTYTVTAETLERLQEDFAAYSCDEAETLAVIGELWQQDGYLCDTHTAVAVHAARAYRAEAEEKRPMLVVSTASPFKFADSVLTALGSGVPENAFAQLLSLSALTERVAPAALARLAELPVRFRGAVRPREMENALLDLLKEM